ncbi:MAG: J domain-containing protein [Desulfobacteraceae bacterium]|nr:J domain-containing protein [Desulfobacteraceae bacterium]
MNPYDILGITPDAGDEAVRKAYLERVKRFPPERAPHRFAAISEAYQALKDEAGRLQYECFNTKTGVASPMEAVVQHFAWGQRPAPPDFETLKRKLRACAGR